MTLATLERSIAEPTLETLRKAGNPFRNYFARNPDDETCARFHVADLFAKERSQLLGVVELYRQTPGTHSEMVPVLGNKGAGKTHLLHSIKHGRDGAGQLLVTPGTFPKDTDFLEYLLFQVIDTLLGGAKQRGSRPLEQLCEPLGRQLLANALRAAGPNEQMELFPAPGLGAWMRKLGIGSTQASERTAWLLDQITQPTSTSLRQICHDCNADSDRVCQLIAAHIEKTEGHDTQGLMRRHLLQGFARAALLGDESELANFLTYGFAELDLKVKPSRQVLVLALFKGLMGLFQSLKVPVVVAFDQLEDLLLARRTDDGHKTAEAFFAGIVQAMHQIEGICFLVFAERGLWNRFVPSLDGYIQDRLNNPVHVPGHGTIKALRLEAPPADLVYRVVETRLRPVLNELANAHEVSTIFPFSPDQVAQIAKTEPTLRDMLQQFRQLFDHLVYGEVQKTAYETETPTPVVSTNIPFTSPRISAVEDAPVVKSMIVVETPSQPKSEPKVVAAAAPSNLWETWEPMVAEARRNLEPEGALTGATRELQAGLGTFLRICHEHGVKVGPWRLQHVVPEFTFGEHPTYGALTVAHWACKDGQPWKVGIGLFLAKGPGKPRDLETKLGALELTPTIVDHLILLRNEDDVALTGKSKTLWQDSEKRGKHARLEAAALDAFAVLYGFPRWLTALSEGMPAGQALPNLADLIQDKCEKLLEQICMPTV